MRSIEREYRDFVRLNIHTFLIKNRDANYDEIIDYLKGLCEEFYYLAQRTNLFPSLHEELIFTEHLMYDLDVLPKDVIVVKHKGRETK